MAPRPRVPGPALGALALLLLVVLLVVGLQLARDLRPGAAAATSDAPPPPGGWFRTLPAGSWSDLPGDAACDRRVHRSLWEPRPDNVVPNHHVPDARAVHLSLATRPRDTANGYDGRWDTWLLPRVTGQHTGTTDENIQWAACKWGISDDLLRAIAYRESGWFQGEVYPSGRCVLQSGCGDLAPTPDPAGRTYCEALARSGRDYQRDFGAGMCPRTFSIVGVKAWQDPRWGPMPGNQNGTFPFSRDSTAFALDFIGAFLRGCQEGWIWWLGNLDPDYGPGDVWGCVGVWYSGEWHTATARRYIGLVRRSAEERPWLAPDWAQQSPPCSPDYGCPEGPTASR